MTAAPATVPLPEPKAPFWRRYAPLVFGILLVYVMIVGVGMIGRGFNLASGGREGAEAIFRFAGNPIIGLVMGMFATVLVQSSSTVTTVIVGMVAGGLPVGTAIPMVMGANIGTTVRNTLVSLAHITRPQEFRRAFAAATVHDFFNLMAVIIFLTLEIVVGAFHPEGKGLLQLISEPLAVWVFGAGEGGGVDLKRFNIVKTATAPLIRLLHDGGSGGLYGSLSPIPSGIFLSVTGLGVIFASIFYLGQLLRNNLTGACERFFHAAIGRGPWTGIFTGTVITVLVQSSSTTTSLVVPMAGAGAISLRQVFPFTLGANIGTTVTALLASLGGGKYGLAAVQIALIHTAFNVLATIVIYGIPPLRAIPLFCAEKLAEIAVKRRILAVAYILGFFFLTPLLIIGVMHLCNGDSSGPPEPESRSEVIDPAPHATIPNED